MAQCCSLAPAAHPPGPRSQHCTTTALSINAGTSWREVNKQALNYTARALGPRTTAMTEHQKRCEQQLEAHAKLAAKLGAAALAVKIKALGSIYAWQEKRVADTKFNRNKRPRARLPPSSSPLARRAIMSFNTASSRGRHRALQASAVT